jgi:hypothetical protein
MIVFGLLGLHRLHKGTEDSNLIAVCIRNLEKNFTLMRFDFWTETFFTIVLVSHKYFLV